MTPLPLLLLLAFVLTSCRSYVESTPRHFSEGNRPANYKRIFRQPIPADVTVVNSAVVTYSFRPGVVTTDDFEFELLASPEWIETQMKRFHLRKGGGPFMLREFALRRERARPWYAPGSLDQYNLYRDLTSAGYVHMLIQKEAEPDGRFRLFISKH